MRFVFEYFIWHYSRAVRDLLNIVMNFIWFFYEFFSIPLLLKTYAAPFKRLNEEYSGGFNLQAWAEAFIINTLMRFVGILMRSVLLLLGISLIILTILVGVILCFVWICAPVLLCFLLIYGCKLVTIP